MEKLGEKAQLIGEVVDRLQHSLGKDAFDIIDHWDADL